jgi:hypothetical protein
VAQLCASCSSGARPTDSYHIEPADGYG